MMLFQEWISQVDLLMVKDFFLTHDEVVDYDWISEFESDTAPEEAYAEWKLLKEDW